VLKQFIEGFDFVKMAPDARVIARAAPASTSVRALSEPGRAYAVYAHGGKQVTLTLRLPTGRYRAEWLNPRSGAVEKTQEIEAHENHVDIVSPDYVEDVALRIRGAASRGIP
jgi:hypothetical protein